LFHYHQKVLDEEEIANIEQMIFKYFIFFIFFTIIIRYWMRRR